MNFLRVSNLSSQEPVVRACMYFPSEYVQKLFLALSWLVCLALTPGLGQTILMEELGRLMAKLVRERIALFLVA